ncbi:DUF2953 domain-containing protein [Oceanobacillus sp. CFH 90083]|uniref:DUF2953 domain-containing protein n=1 Tax=Oceanobacillus sp. CFH 90083 TaxID=2592336 RepID=UPI00128C60D3|nr:DUF2953 domain-containing protein [Oceanobacillus sp. CFH 90083]
MNSLYILLIFIAVSILISVFILQSKWIVKINYQFPERNDLQISVFFYKWCVLRQKKVRISSQTEVEKGYLHFLKLLQQKRLHLSKELRFPFLLKEMKILEFKWWTKGGTGNAFTTSVANGTVWAVKGWLVSYLSRHLQFLVNPQIHVQPDFQNSSLQTRFSCMISFRLGKTILGIMRDLK